MPSRTLCTSAPTSSQKRAIWFMNEMRVASIALAAYLVTSAEAMSMNRIRSPPWRVNGPYSSPMTAFASSSSMPMTTRSGFMKSSIAAPSLRNSGFEHTANGSAVSDCTAARTFSAVPTGTVDLVTITLWPFMLRPISLATPSTCWRSAEPSSPGGVPTAMNTTRAARTADGRSVVKVSRPSSWFRFTIGSSPGS